MTVTDWITEVATAFIAVFTVVLACVGRRQMLDTRILQRAYLSVEPKGIVTDTNSNLLDHLAFKNVGKLPATEFISVVMNIMVHHGNWDTPPLTDSAFRDDQEPGLIPIGAEVPQGSPGITQAEVAQAEVPAQEVSLCVGAGEVQGWIQLWPLDQFLSPLSLGQEQSGAGWKRDHL